MSKHTPGPWSKAETRTEGFVITSRNELIVHSVDEYGHYGPIKNSANANLIAAAPDLLEACIQSRAILITILAEITDKIARSVITARIEMLSATIARAKGESQ